MAKITTITNPLTGQPVQVDELDHTAQEIDDAIARALPGGAIDIALQNKLDLNNSGQISYAQSSHLTSSVTIYVDSTNGNDHNAGTQSAPFKTIQAAIDSLPRNFDKYDATIYVAAGTYSENVFISGFIGGEGVGLSIFGDKNVANSTTRIVSTFTITGCAAPILLNGFYVTGTRYGHAIRIDGTPAYLYYMNCKGPTSNATYGITVGSNSFASAVINRCTVVGYTNGVAISCGSIVTGLSNSIQNNTTGIVAGNQNNGTAGIFMAGTLANTFSGNTSNTAKYGGSQIFGV